MAYEEAARTFSVQDIVPSHPPVSPRDSTRLGLTAHPVGSKHCLRMLPREVSRRCVVIGAGAHRAMRVIQGYAERCLDEREVPTSAVLAPWWALEVPAEQDEQAEPEHQRQDQSGPMRRR
jgi:hypothetical protein